MDNELMLDVGQANGLKMAFRRAGWTNADIKKFSEGSLAEQVLMVIKDVATIVRACFKLVLDKTFNPEFVGKNWKIWKGPADGDGLNGDEDCVSEPDVIDFEQIVMETHLQGDETNIKGEEKMQRARAGKNRQLGGRAFLALWNNWLACKAADKPEDSILEMLYRAKKIGNVIYFFGLALRDSFGRRCVLCLYRVGGGAWRWGFRWLGGGWGVGDPSVSLASVDQLVLSS